MTRLKTVLLSALMLVLGVVPAVFLLSDPLPDPQGADDAGGSGSRVQQVVPDPRPDSRLIDVGSPADDKKDHDKEHREDSDDSTELGDDDVDEADADDDWWSSADQGPGRWSDPATETPAEEPQGGGAACSYYDRSACGPGDGYGQTETPAESAETEDGGGGLLGILFGG